MSIIARLPGNLGSKINAILLLFFLVALTMIILTLYVGRQLQGGAAAINEAGAERMRTYRIAYLLERSLNGAPERPQLLAEAREMVASFETALALLEEGDPERPLFLPREIPVQLKVQTLRAVWQEQLRPLMLGAMSSLDAVEQRRLLLRLDQAIREFVPMINELVLLIEKSNSRNTQLMWTFQNALVGFALAGTLFLSYVFSLLVIRPVENLERGMESMAAADFSVRLPVDRNDEFGELAAGFNRMADHLRDLYTTLEQRVADKTRDIEARNLELAALYEIAAYLSSPADIETLCRGALAKLRSIFGAQAGAVRLMDSRSQTLDIVVADGLSGECVEAERHLPAGACLCGRAALDGVSVTQWPADRWRMLPHCGRAGMETATAIPITLNNQVLGVFNLFFDRPRQLAPGEVRFLEAVGQHLAVAIENHRLVVREKEMAVSEERNLLAQELHDSIAQSLAFLNIQAQMLQGSLRAGEIEPAKEELARMREGIQESYDNVRELLVHFRIRVEHTDLDDAIASALEKFEAQTGIRTRFERQGEALATPASCILQILHIVQEALSNVRKHAAASRVDILRRHGGGELTISIRDDGQGFEPTAVVESGGVHVGLGIMRERAFRIGGRIELEADSGCGTCVTLAVPNKS